MIERILEQLRIKPVETYVVFAKTADKAIRDSVLPVAGETYDNIKCVSLDVTQARNLRDTFVVVAKFEVQLPDEYFMLRKAPVTRPASAEDIV